MQIQNINWSDEELKKMAGNLIENALLDLANPHVGKTLWREIAEWFFADPVGYRQVPKGFSLAWCCRVLGLDEEELIEQARIVMIQLGIFKARAQAALSGNEDALVASKLTDFYEITQLALFGQPSIRRVLKKAKKAKAQKNVASFETRSEAPDEGLFDLGDFA